jgi:phosphoglycerate dehydrogenase-like enzyme
MSYYSTSPSDEAHSEETRHASLNQPIVVITDTEFAKAEHVFTSDTKVRCVASPAGEDQLAAAIRETDARFAIVGILKYRDALYSALPRGGVIARFGVGHDGIDKALATRAGVLCTNTPGVLNQSVAELTMLLILSAARHLTVLSAEMKARVWAARPGTELSGKTLAVIGCGSIGGAVARIAGMGFGMKVRCAGRGDDFAETVRDGDFVSLHLSGTADNRRFLNGERLAMLPKHAWLINTARGSVVDEAALYDALAERRLAGAALDVFEREPYEPEDPARDLRTLPNVILTPHVGSHTPDASGRIAERALHNIRLAAAGDFAAMDLVNPEVLLTPPLR